MASTRSFNLSLQDGESIPVPLGRELRLPAHGLDGPVLEKKFIGMHIEDSSLPIVIAPGSDTAAFLSVNDDPATSFVSPDIQRLGDNTILPAPLTTAGSYRYHVQLAYEALGSPRNIVASYTLTSLSGGISSATFQDIVPGRGIVSFDFYFKGTEFRQGTFANTSSTSSLTILRNLSGNPNLPADTYYEIEYIGNV